MAFNLDERFHGSYGCFGIRNRHNRHIWDVYGEYEYQAVMDDFGNLIQIGPATNVRGY